MGIDLSPLVKYGILGVLLLTICLAIFGAGLHVKQIQWDAEIAEQQLRTGEFIMKQTYNSVLSEQANQKNRQRQDAEKLLLSKKVRDYEAGTSGTCELSPEFESVADGLVRVRESTADRLPAAADSAGVADGKDQARLTDVAVLRFIETAVTKLNACADQANALIDWESSSRAIAMEGAGRDVSQ